MDQAARILVFVVAYNAEQHIRSVFERIPAGLYEDPRYHFLIIDDASSDAGSRLIADWVHEHDYERITVLRNRVNQGYGGNQKLGYRLAIDAGFDFVILLHGDGQYAPELLPRFVECWQQTDADVVLGSRMRRLRQALQGGMPLYKAIGNRVLTAYQNLLTGQKLSEYHTGYRAYTTRLLRQVPFETNTNDFHFDTELLLQARGVGAQITEFDIPTHYGDEVCHVDGMDYAGKVATTTAQFALQQVGIFCSLKFRTLKPNVDTDQTELRYSSNIEALARVAQENPGTVLDLGCGPGHVSRKCRALGARVTGVDRHPPLPGSTDTFLQVDLDRSELPIDAFGHDVVLMLDVLEHLNNPEEFLIGLRNRSESLSAVSKPPLVVISTPNVAFAAIRLNLLLGRFTYAERGILKIGNKRLFTRSSLLRTLEDCGYKVESVQPVGVPFEAVLPGRGGAGLGRLAKGMASAWQEMFAFQFLVCCRPLPGTRQLIAGSQKMQARDAVFADTLQTEPGPPAHSA